MARKVHAGLVLHEFASVASKAALVRFVVVAYHRSLEDVASYDQQAGEEVRVQELPGALAPFAERVTAYQLADLKVIVKLSDDLFSV